MGTPPTNPARVAKKSPNRTNRPYSSIANPMNVQRRRMRTMPRAKVTVPRIFCGRAKKERVLEGPRIRGRPIRKRIYLGVVSGRTDGGFVVVVRSYVSHCQQRSIKE